ncbi:uncharacterized protein LOC110977472 [Acanthaster planci]|uniref:Uncharacterized protein LOC110977472 n=1 Tax=Acanthaster planci TaxID=133434 RepID=A0A8B7Y4T8_ACAPL|nr:uncharacterized protein LOC110977472 [Acanthaster planci]
MHKTLLLLALFLRAAEGNWDGDGSDSDPAIANMGFFVHNMTCNEYGTVCQHCKKVEYYGKAYLAVAEYKADPYTFQCGIEDGTNDWNFNFGQEDPSELYRWCDSIEGRVSKVISMKMRYTLCAENMFSGISVPSDCPRPVALVTFDAHLADEKIQGQQLLFCLP